MTDQKIELIVNPEINKKFKFRIKQGIWPRHIRIHITEKKEE